MGTAFAQVTPEIWADQFGSRANGVSASSLVLPAAPSSCPPVEPDLGVTLPRVHQGADEIELTLVTMTFDASDPEKLLGALAKYVVLARGHQGCRNIDLAASATRPGRFVIVQKWESPEAQQSHFDSADMVEMAEACRGLLVAPPTIDLLEPITAHDLA
jgi:quinol monooxygenase YgiN